MGLEFSESEHQNHIVAYILLYNYAVQCCVQNNYVVYIDNKISIYLVHKHIWMEMCYYNIYL